MNSSTIIEIRNSYKRDFITNTIVNEYIKNKLKDFQNDEFNPNSSEMKTLKILYQRNISLFRTIRDKDLYFSDLIIKLTNDLVVKIQQNTDGLYKISDVMAKKEEGKKSKGQINYEVLQSTYEKEENQIMADLEKADKDQRENQKNLMNLLENGYLELIYIYEALKQIKIYKRSILIQIVLTKITPFYIKVFQYLCVFYFSLKFDIFSGVLKNNGFNELLIKPSVFIATLIIVDFPVNKTIIFLKKQLNLLLLNELKIIFIKKSKSLFYLSKAKKSFPELERIFPGSKV